ncbi:hypothetical protein SAY87_008664 [Trapa incisa]|uniref:Uncharacterized protein n=1 Tax=Trapa incisa TaxID=236973 RepID=A0AAN7PVD8_9MYRT|nr:hypothetical protein SAY87_008664 [Trapa incisa]
MKFVDRIGNFQPKPEAELSVKRRKVTSSAGNLAPVHRSLNGSYWAPLIASEAHLRRPQLLSHFWRCPPPAAHLR